MGIPTYLHIIVFTHPCKKNTYKNTMSATPLVELTSELLARASSTSEVLTLNLTNLLILIVLKAIIFGFGLFSVGSSARSSEDTSLSQADLRGWHVLYHVHFWSRRKIELYPKNSLRRPQDRLRIRHCRQNGLQGSQDGWT